MWSIHCEHSPHMSDICSVVLWGGRNTPNKYHSCVGSARSVWTTLGLPQLTAVCAFWVYTAQAPGCSEGELTKAGPGFCAPPRCKLLRFRLLSTPQRHRLSWACVLCPFQVQAAQETRCLMNALSPGEHHVLSPPLFQPLGFLGAQGEHCLRRAVCLLWGADLWLQPSWWMSTIQHPRKTWLANGSLLTVW